MRLNNVLYEKMKSGYLNMDGELGRPLLMMVDFGHKEAYFAE